MNEKVSFFITFHGCVQLLKHSVVDGSKHGPAYRLMRLTCLKDLVNTNCHIVHKGFLKFPYNAHEDKMIEENSFATALL